MSTFTQIKFQQVEKKSKERESSQLDYNYMAEKIAKFSLKEINLVLKRLSKKQFGVNYFLGAFFFQGIGGTLPQNSFRP